ncbi:MAG: tRNA (adenosine(37)-N6)-threonylcarbamoyltransferase complex transferase subunit TsaD [Clostridiaceae bacterium]|jgi:N6-L-threonylcarbamoyladenine synthase|nr:tRNA (adenosine(37)-N6)-threonylcarbamoyltransferase complex transferase subunit TsaD [Oscillospiraceae bacterium]NLO62673.1 tRNA (adenosine(37)-N6)-threonylcarbamoyltransferase complex transferase subunit TsaD [Clostridiaceae bacterium]
MKIITLGIESSCDETACAVVSDGTHVLSSVISSQAGFHSTFGGVVPELASRMHVETIIPCVREALEVSGKSLSDIDAICVTKGPGLVGALLVGISSAKGLSEVSGKPLIGVGHIDSHVAANYLVHDDFTEPYVALIVSGGHTEIVYVQDDRHKEVIGRTRDDAAGEAIDKIARVIGLGYPGGPKMDAAGKDGDSSAYSFPRTFFPESFDFSFSGLKTAALNIINQATMANKEINVSDFSASYLRTISEVLVENSIKACLNLNCRRLCLAGGVSANSVLRKAMIRACEQNQIKLYYPPIELCTDNAAMVAAAGYLYYCKGVRDDLSLNAQPSLRQ